jgi:hypothetical protein
LEFVEEAAFGSSSAVEDWVGGIVAASVDLAVATPPAPGGMVVERGGVERWFSVKGAIIGGSEVIDVAGGAPAEVFISEERAISELVVVASSADV